MQNYNETFSSLGILDRYDVVSNWKNKDEAAYPNGVGFVKKGEEQYPPEVIFFKRDGKFMYSLLEVVLDSLGSGNKYLDCRTSFDYFEECFNHFYLIENGQYNGRKIW